MEGFSFPRSRVGTHKEERMINTWSTQKAIVFVGLVLCGFLFAEPASWGLRVVATTPEGKEIPLYNNSYALVIGNGNYTRGWDPLPGAIRDVKDVARALEKNGFKVTLKKNLTKDSFNKVFGRFCYKYGRKTNNRLLFYYAGHGHTLEMATGEDLGYLVMVDAPVPEKDPLGFELSSVDMQTMVTQAKKIKARHVLFMFDSCFSGSILNLRERVVPQNISDSVKLPVRQFITAGRANEPVPDHSIFKQAFLDLLEGRDKEPIPDGYITGEELGLYLKNKVPVYNPAQHPQYGKIRDIRLDKGDFVFQLASSSGVTIEEQAPTPVKAVLKVTSNVSDSTVFVDGARKGVTPVTLKGLRAGRHRIKVAREGYEPYEERIFLRQGKSLTVRAFLEQRKSTVEVTGAPAGAKVYLDGYYSGSLPLDATEMKPGPHTVKVVKKGYHGVEKTISLEAGRGVRLKVDLRAIAKAVSEPKTFTNSIGMKFVLIPAGGFMMGSGISASEVASQYGGKEEWYKREQPQHRVTISKPFYMQTREVTVGQWRSFVQDSGYKTEAETGGGAYVWTGKKWEKKEGAYWDNPGFGQSDNNPVTCVSWNDVQAFLKWLNSKEGKNYRLPTEAEWEYAARAGSTTRFCYGNNKDGLDEYAWYGDNSGRHIHPVAQKKPNSWGLYDMHGNVWEWCQDWYGDYSSGSVTDPTGPSLGAARVNRGGGWILSAGLCRSADRDGNAPGGSSGNLGFRLAMTQ